MNTSYRPLLFYKTFDLYFKNQAHSLANTSGIFLTNKQRPLIAKDIFSSIKPNRWLFFCLIFKSSSFLSSSDSAKAYNDAMLSNRFERRTWNANAGNESPNKAPIA